MFNNIKIEKRSLIMIKQEICTIFNDETTKLLLDYIRKNIYKEYSYESLSSSVLLSGFRIELDEYNIEYIQVGISKQKIPYAWDTKYKIFIGENFIGEVNSLRIELYDSKKNKEYLKSRKRQCALFNHKNKKLETKDICEYCQEEYLESKSTANYEKEHYCSAECESYWHYDY